MTITVSKVTPLLRDMKPKLFFLTYMIEIDMFTMKEFKRLADEVPEAQVMYCPGIQYSQEPGEPGEDVYWVRKIYKDVSIHHY